MKVSPLFTQQTTGQTANNANTEAASFLDFLNQASPETNNQHPKTEQWNSYFDKNIHRFAEYLIDMPNLKEDFAQILNATHQSDALTDPKEALLSLSTEQREVVQKVHRIAEPLTDQRIQNLTEEGAHNLLLSPENTRDIDGNGLTTIADANMFKFPTEHTDPQVAKAWNEFTANLSFEDKMFAEFRLMNTIIMANFNADTKTDVDVHDPNFVNPLNDEDFSYYEFLDDIYGNLEFMKPEIGDYEYQRQMDMWKSFEALLDKYTKPTAS